MDMRRRIMSNTAPPVARHIGLEVLHNEAVRAADAYNWQVTMLDDAAQCSRRDA